MNWRVSVNIWAQYAVEETQSDVDQGEFLTLLGPSGCGKTTILRMIAGFELPSTGHILLDGEDITDGAANKSPMGMVFQSYALFPHLTAEQNIAFGMQLRKQPKSTIKERCAELLELVGLGDKGGNYPHQLSGGQQQRVALARALAVHPRFYCWTNRFQHLMPKFVSHCATKSAASNRVEDHRHVCHPRSGRVAGHLRSHRCHGEGRIEQLDYPEEIYSHPHTVFAATFVGNSNQFRGQLSANDHFSDGKQTLSVPTGTELPAGTQVLVLVRPESVSLRAADETTEGGFKVNQLAGVIELREFLGPFTRFHVRLTTGTTVLADLPNQQATAFSGGQQVLVHIPDTACQVLSIGATSAIEDEPEMANLS